MPCTRPVPAWWDQEVTSLVFGTSEAALDLPVTVPCGKCPDCLLRRRTDWALRMEFEAREHDHTSFLTLTYDQEHLPADLGLDLRHWQQFVNRARKHWRFRYFHCGEYGGRSLRPHYHAAIFGEDWHADRALWKITDAGDPLYVSERLNDAWGKGLCVIGTFTPASARYVAKYATKYLDQDKREERVDPLTGECWTVAPEYATMSRRPGLGHRYYERWKDEVYRHDSVISSGREWPVPRYYDRLLRDDDLAVHEQTQLRRRKAASEAPIDYDRRDLDRETILNHKRRDSRQKETL